MMQTETTELARQIRLTALKLCHEKKASHLGGAYSVADLLAVLYGDYLHHSPSRADHPERDRLFYSKGHACTALYSVLGHMGYFPLSQLHEEFTANGSYFTSHVNHHLPGVELSTGSLGHALGVACGVAIALQRKQSSSRVVAVLSDGELDEGSNWEAILFANHHRLANLTMIIDYNKIQSFGSVAEVMRLDPLADKLNAFGWHTLEIDGHDHMAIHAALAETSNSAPKAIIAHTVKGKGVSFMEHQLAWHYKSPNASEYQLALQELGA